MGDWPFCQVSQLLSATSGCPLWHSWHLCGALHPARLSQQTDSAAALPCHWPLSVPWKHITHTFAGQHPRLSHEISRTCSVSLLLQLSGQGQSIFLHSIVRNGYFTMNQRAFYFRVKHAGKIPSAGIQSLIYLLFCSLFFLASRIWASISRCPVSFSSKLSLTPLSSPSKLALLVDTSSLKNHSLAVQFRFPSRRVQWLNLTWRLMGPTRWYLFHLDHFCRGYFHSDVGVCLGYDPPTPRGAWSDE